MADVAAPARPVLRWHGGKWRLAPWIIAHLPEHRTYVEPFSGAASVLLRKSRSYAEVVNDLDAEVVNLFRVLRHPVQAAELVTALELTPFARDEWRAAAEPSTNPVERARAMVIRSFMGFGSNGAILGTSTGFRCNTTRNGTTPASDWANYPDALRSIIERFRGVVVENRDALACMAQHDRAETLFYVDPPYRHETRQMSWRRHEYAHEMDGDAHARLLAELPQMRGMVVLSGYPHPSYDDALAGWRRVECQARADQALPRTEALWINPAAVARLDGARAQAVLL